ncbi:hypothetical protein IE53DRAFT_78733 [Violaceomyces palustris]|uniref:Uncharacterized protein n=1 Tax=Violaceomyces palustris TaxID=1673888 RepID=A0ACD0NYD2_9BASI|nr:hypothetical protein IE53DRAFT_78733 [Violaceomyces palustris]
MQQQQQLPSRFHEPVKGDAPPSFWPSDDSVATRHSTAALTATQVALDLPGHSIFQSDPHRLAVLSLQIQASSSILSLSQSLPVRPTQSPFTESHRSPRNHHHDGFSTTHARRVSGAPITTSSRQLSPSLAVGDGTSLRPTSVDFGIMRAKEAFGNFARGVISSSTDRSHQHAEPLSSVRSPNELEHFASLPAGEIQSEARAQRTYTVRPHSLTYGRGSKLASYKVPLDIEVVSWHSFGFKSEQNGGDEQRPSQLTVEPVEFISDPSPSFATVTDPLGTFSAASSDSEGESPHTLSTSLPPPKAPFDPTRMLLKVEPPAALAHQVWSRRPSTSSRDTNRLCETHAIQLRFRLRLCPSASSKPPVSPTGPPQSTTQDLGRVIFVSSESASRIADMIQVNSSALLSKESAALEGVSWELVNEIADDAGRSRGARDCDFVWDWKPRHRGKGSIRDGKGSGTGKCCCAFVEVGHGNRASVLAAFSFWIEIPTTALAVAPSSSSPVPPLPPQRERMSRTARPHSQADSLSLVASLNNEYGKVDAFQAFSSPEETSTAGVFQESSDNFHSASTEEASEERFPRSGSKLDVNRTEITLDDVESDSPILRAAIANLERRTTSLKKVSKNALKVATDLRARLSALGSTEEAFGVCLRELSGMMPGTVGRLEANVLSASRKSSQRLRLEQMDMLQRNVILPLHKIVEQCRLALEKSKAFESESKSFYSQTQKWLANRAMPPVSSNDSQTSSAAVGNGAQSQVGSAYGAEKPRKQERADEKQKLRQLRFTAARLDVYKAMYMLHGGHMELELLACLVALSSWLVKSPCVSSEREDDPDSISATLASISSSIKASEASVASDLASIYAKGDSLDNEIRSVEVLLGKALVGGDFDEAVDTGLSNENFASLEADHPTSAAKQASHKIRSFLGSFGMGNQSSPTSARQAQTINVIEATPTKSPTGKASEIKRKVSLKLHSSSRSTPVTPKVTSPSLGSQNYGRNAHEVDSKAPQLPLAMPDSNLSDSFELGFPASTDPSSLSSRVADLFGSPVSGSAQPDSMQSPLLAGKRASLPPKRTLSSGSVAPVTVTRSPSMGHNENRRGRGGPTAATSGLGIGGVAVDSNNVDAARTPERALAASSRVPSPPVAGRERKKEGVLWVMSKAISGVGGPDAPRSLNRTAYWKESWVVLSGSGHLGEYADWKDAKILEPTNPLIDLRFATVREARGLDRRFTFEVITRDSRRFFQAPDEVTMRDWIKAISRAIESLLNGTSSVRKLERAVKASPFTREPGIDEDPLFIDDFGASIGGAGLSALRPFSRSMTDLGAGPKPSSKNLSGDTGAPKSSKKDGRKNAGHLSTLSESYPSSWANHAKDQSSGSKHERGISNKTPTSGYMLSSSYSAHAFRVDAPQLQPAFLGAGLAGSEYFDGYFDRRIEEMVNSNFAGGDGHHSHTKVLDGDTATEKMIPPFPVGSPSCDLDNPIASPCPRPRSKAERAAEIVEIAQRPQNLYCADCREANPRWASWALDNKPRCIFICIACSGVHRSLGVQTSKVKSVDLDDWTEEQLDAARQWGNDKVNSIYEWSKPDGVGPDNAIKKNAFGVGMPDSGGGGAISKREGRNYDNDPNLFWKLKYVEGAWKKPSSGPQPLANNLITEVVKGADVSQEGKTRQNASPAPLVEKEGPAPSSLSSLPRSPQAPPVKASSSSFRPHAPPRRSSKNEASSPSRHPLHEELSNSLSHALPAPNPSSPAWAEKPTGVQMTTSCERERHGIDEDRRTLVRSTMQDTKFFVSDLEDQDHRTRQRSSEKSARNLFAFPVVVGSRSSNDFATDENFKDGGLGDEDLGSDSDFGIGE